MIQLPLSSAASWSRSRCEPGTGRGSDRIRRRVRRKSRLFRLLQRHDIRLLAGCGCARIGVDGESGWDLLAVAITGHYLFPAASRAAGAGGACLGTSWFGSPSWAGPSLPACGTPAGGFPPWIPPVRPFTRPEWTERLFRLGGEGSGHRAREPGLVLRWVSVRVELVQPALSVWVLLGSIGRRRP